MSGPVKLKQGEYLFKEGQESDACYVVKSGKVAIVKDKGNSEIELAQLGPGQMFGEMAFFDNQPRSAGAKAVTPEATVIALPFKALNAQFKTFPEWLKAMVKTVNDHLRAANKKIKTLENVEKQSETMFDPYNVVRLLGIISLVAHRYGESNSDGSVEISGGIMRRYTIQVFQQPTFKMQRMMETLSELGIMKVEDIGEGQQKITVMDKDELCRMVDYYTIWIFKPQEKRVDVQERDLPLLEALLHFSKKIDADDKGNKKINLTEIQNESMKELGYVVQVPEWDPMIERGLVGDKIQEKDAVFAEFNYDEISKITPYWKTIYTLLKVPSRK